MTVIEALLEAWDRQCRIVTTLAHRVDETNKHAKAAHNGRRLDEQLAHIHEARKFHLAELDQTAADSLPEPPEDLAEIKQALQASGRAVKDALSQALQEDRQQSGGFDHPVFFLEHLICHEGWHIGAIVQALTEAGQEPPEPWQEAKIWGVWRTD